jgi:hypothetical protein
MHLSAIAAGLFAAEVEMARRTENLGYMARVMAQVTLPHSKPTGNEYTRHNGKLVLSMWSPKHIGLPYGGVPRLLISWLTTEAVRTRDRTLILGPTLSGFMSQLGLVPTGGRWGTIPRLQEQLRRLFACQIVCTFDTSAASGGSSFGVASEYELWWNPKKPHYGSLWNSTVTLGENFYEDIIRRPVPVDIRTLRLLKRSPLALDVYTWLTYRYSYLERATLIPWEGIQAQFGADYKELYNFRYGCVRNCVQKGLGRPLWVDRGSSGGHVRPSPRWFRSVGLGGQAWADRGSSPQGGRMSEPPNLCSLYRHECTHST